MSLTRTDTGQAATPLEQIQEMNERKRLETENALLKEALMISNEKCNALIDRQNALVEDLTAEVNRLRKDNDEFQLKIRFQALTAVDRAEKIVEQEREFKKQVSQEIAEAMRETAGEVTTYAKSQMDKSTEEVKKQLAVSAKEIEKQRNELKEQGLFRKFFFWATPVLALVQTIAMLFLLFR